MKAPALHRSAAVIALLGLALSGCGSAPPAVPPTPLEDIVNPSILVLEQWKSDHIYRKPGVKLDYISYVHGYGHLRGRSYHLYYPYL